MPVTDGASENIDLFNNPEQDARTARSARMIQPYTDEEIELIYNQPQLEQTHEHRHSVSE